MAKHVLVICSQRENYFELFKGFTLDSGEPIIVDQAPWVDIEAASYPDSGLLVQIRPNRNPFPGTEQSKFRTFSPDFVLLRSYALGNHEHDWRRKLFAFFHADVPCLNSIDSFVWSVEKASHYTKLRRVQKKLPDFPFIPQVYYSHPHMGTFPPSFPCVLKVGSSSQGVGKSKVNDMSHWLDCLSLLHMTTEYFVSEPFITWKADVRVQKIGDNYRAILRGRTSDQSPWKANEGVGISEKDVPVEDRWKRWLDAAATELDMEICGMDVLVDDQDKEFILEVNSSSIGFPARHAPEDCGHIRDLCMKRMNEIFVHKKVIQTPKAKTTYTPSETVAAQSQQRSSKLVESKQKESSRPNINLYTLASLLVGLIAGATSVYLGTSTALYQ